MSFSQSALQKQLSVIEVAELTKQFEDSIAVDNVSFSIQPGEITGYLGPNGAGKSTTVRMLTGMLKPDSGRVTICGFDMADQPLEVKQRIGYVPESAEMYPTLTINEYLSLVAELHDLDPDDARKRIGDLLDAFEVAKVANRQIGQLSKGMRQKVLLTSALIHNPRVLLLDEPLNGLDVNSVLTFRRILEGLAERGTTVLYCSHILDVVERMCRRVIVIDSGKIIADSPTHQLVRQSKEGTLEAVFRDLTKHTQDNSDVSDFLSALDDPDRESPERAASNSDGKT